MSLSESERRIIVKRELEITINRSRQSAPIFLSKNLEVTKVFRNFTPDFEF